MVGAMATVKHGLNGEGRTLMRTRRNGLVLIVFLFLLQGCGGGGGTGGGSISSRYSITDIGPLPGDAQTTAYDLNNGRVVGTSWTPAGVSHAFVWKNGQMTSLPGLQ